jgi:hypothetical protein
MLILYADSFDIDWGLLVTLLVALFGLVLKLAVNDARMEQKIDDLPCNNCPIPKKKRR